MRPKPLISKIPLFQVPLERLVDEKHPLVKLADLIAWPIFDERFGGLYTDDAQGGHPPLPTRLMVGLHYLKYTFNVSDEQVVAQWIENPYWQYFCGMTEFRHELPCDPSSLSRWRKRIGAEAMKALLEETWKTALRGKFATAAQAQEVVVDTTVQEKAVAFPTDARLLNKAREVVVRAAERSGMVLNQTYKRIGKRLLIRYGRYMHAKQFKRAKRVLKRLRTILGRVLRDVGRKVIEMNAVLAIWVARAQRIFEQKRHDKNKLYSLHAPEVSCIAKGKAKVRYEFGAKVGITTTAKGNWAIGVATFAGNPFDGATLRESLTQAELVTGKPVKRALVDQGYRGKTHHPEGVNVVVVGRKQKNLSRCERRQRGRRASIEPVIGHLKSDHRMQRNFLKGSAGDSINAVLAACGFNLRKLLRAFFLWLFSWFFEFKPGREDKNHPLLLLETTA